MKIEILITDTNGFVLEEFSADMSDAPAESPADAARWLRDQIENFVDTEEV